MWDFINYWWGCVQAGWEFGDGIFERIETVSILASGFFLCHRKLRKHRETLEEHAMKISFYIFAAAFLISTVFVAPFIKDKKSAGDLSDMSLKNSRLQGQLDDKSPKLEGFIHRTVPMDGSSPDSTIFLDVSISNLGGTPSDAEEYGLKVILSTNISVIGEELKFTNEYTLNFFHKEQQWLLDLKRPQLIAEKTISSIPTGEHRRGWLAYRLHGLKTGQYELTNIVFSFVDNYGRRIAATNGFWMGNKSFLTNTDDIATVIPGAENIFYPISPEIITNWLPPELPPGCSNVTVYFGASGIIYSRSMAEISSEGTKFAIKDLPDFMLGDMEKIPNYSPHLENMWIRWSSINQDYGGKTVDLPILPFVVSNRFYVDVQIPFLNEKRKLVMSREFDPELSKLPKNWDWNYSTNYNSTRGIFYYEIVNEFSNPVLQVFYTAPNEVHIFGIFIVNTNQLLETFGGPPQLLTLNMKFISKENGKEITDADEIKKELGTNSVATMMTNFMYDLKFPESKSIFKYPFNRYPNVFSDDLVETNKSDTKTLDGGQ
jgi:hypothetical protein